MIARSNRFRRTFLAQSGAASGAFGLLLVLQKAFARLEFDGIDTALERLGHCRVRLETGTRFGLFTEQLEKHGTQATSVNEVTKIRAVHPQASRMFPDVGLR